MHRGLLLILAAGACRPAAEPRLEPALRATPASVGAEVGSIEAPKLVIRPQSPDEAFEYLWGVLQQMPFFRENGYEVALPDDPLLVELGDDRDKLRAHFVEKIYSAKMFDAALAELRAFPELHRAVLDVFERWRDAWGFEVKPHYEVLLTLYGPGGSYDVERGSITLWTTADGAFKGGGGSHTIVHEMVHLGIEEVLVRRYRLTHWEKERLVDLVCANAFAEMLGGYELQGRGDSALDPFIDSASLADLPAAVERYVAENPR